MQLTIERAGVIEEFRLTDPIPVALDGYPFPADIAAAVAASDAAHVRLNEAQSDWEDAAASTELAAKADDDALRSAIQAKKPDPGTPHTDTAKRAEHVAWTAFSMARIECERDLQAGRAAIVTYLHGHAADLAAWELARLTQYYDAHRKFTAAQTARDVALEGVGLASRLMGSYVAARWSENQDLETRWQIDASRWTNYWLHNDTLEAKWKALATTGTEPPPADITDKPAGELATAVRFGNAPEARAELKRRRAASKAATL